MKNTVLFLLVILSSCSNLFHSDGDDKVIARANDKKLYLSELSKVIPDGLPERDSITLAENFITKWVQNEILIQKAKENLKSEDQDFTRQLDEYRNSLLLYALEQKLVQQYLDTVVTDAEIETYFMQNRSQFELKGNIVKFDFVKAPKRARNLRDCKNLLKGTRDSLNMMRLTAYAEKIATDYWFATEWVSFNDLLDVMPLEMDNQALFLRRTTYAETTDSLYTYLVRINDYKTADSTSPVEFERDKIRNIILNTRKNELIERKRQEFINQAFRDDNAKIY